MADPDLNLVRVFVTVFETESVTAAAEVLHLTQPTVTHALNRLRRQLQDQLFVRSRTGVTPTALARRAYPSFVEALDRIAQTFQLGVPFDPEHAGTTFRLGMSDAGEVSVLPPIAGALRERAPGVKLEVEPVDVELAEGQLLRGEVDGFVSSAVFGSGRVHRQVLFSEPYAVLLATDHPRLAAGIDSTQLDREPHIMVAGVTGHLRPAMMQTERGVEVAMQVPRFTALPYLIAGTELVAIVPRYVAEVFAGAGRVRAVDGPWPVEPIEVSVYARHPHSRSAEQAWLLQTIIGGLANRYAAGDPAARTSG